MWAKWLSSPYTWTKQPSSSSSIFSFDDSEPHTFKKVDVIGKDDNDSTMMKDDCDELELIFSE